MIIHVGRKVPKHLEELPGSIHLGRGIWAFKCALRKTSGAERRSPDNSEAQVLDDHSKTGTLTK